MLTFRERSRYVKAWRLLEEARWSEALANFDLLSIALRSDCDVMYARAVCYARLGNEEEAELLCDQLTVVHRDPRGAALKKLIPGAQREEKVLPKPKPARSIVMPNRTLRLRILVGVILLCGLLLWLGWFAETGEPATTPDLTGTWECYWGDVASGPCRISGEVDALSLVNERGAPSRGYCDDGITLIALDWQDGLEGRLSDKNTRIQWANGSVWIRAGEGAQE